MLKILIVYFMIISNSFAHDYYNYAPPPIYRPYIGPPMIYRPFNPYYGYNLPSPPINRPYYPYQFYDRHFHNKYEMYHHKRIPYWNYPDTH